MNTIQDYINETILKSIKDEKNFREVYYNNGQFEILTENGEDNTTLFFDYEPNGDSVERLDFDCGTIYLNETDYEFDSTDVDGLIFPSYLIEKCSELYRDEIYDINDMPDNSDDRS